MSREELKKILKVGIVDAGNNTIFGFPRLCRSERDTLHLIIGIGKTGISVIKEVLSDADQKLEREYRCYVKFIALDKSPSKELNSLKRTGGCITLPFSPEGTFDADLLTLIIKGEFDRDWAYYRDWPVDLMILAGLGEEMGSRHFIETAAFAKAACPDLTRVRVFGYLLLPDTLKEQAVSEEEKQIFYGNGFAALKRLESYMSFGFCGQEAKVVLSSAASSNTVTLNACNPPFDYPVLISEDYDRAVSMIAKMILYFVADSGGRLSPTAAYACRLWAVDNALSRYAVSENGILRLGACPEDSHLYLGNGYAEMAIPEKVVIPHIIGQVCRKLYLPDPECKAWNGEQGDAPAFCSGNKALTRKEFEQQIRILFGLDNKPPLTTDSFAVKINNLLQACCRLENNEWELSYKDVREGEVENYITSFRIKMVAERAVVRFWEEVMKQYEIFCHGAETIMKQYGPLAMIYLYTGNGGVGEDCTDISVRAMIQAAADRLCEVAAFTFQYPETGMKAGVFDRIRHRLGFHNKLDEWKDQAKKAAQQEVCQKVAAAATGAGEYWEKEYVKKVEDYITYCQHFSDVLEIMTDFYAEEGKSLDSDDFEEFSQTTGEPNQINLCQDTQTYLWVKERIKRKVDGIRIADVKENLVSDFLYHSEDWLSEEPGKARRRFDYVMGVVCEIGKFTDCNTDNKKEETGRCLKLSLADYFDELLKDVPEIEQPEVVNTAVARIMKPLIEKSAPRLNICIEKAGYCAKYFLLPSSMIHGRYGGIVQKAFEQFDKNCDYSLSSVSNVIACYQVVRVVTLAALTDLSTWEDAYDSLSPDLAEVCVGDMEPHYIEMTKTETDRVRNCPVTEKLAPEEELLFGTGLSWKHYPSVNILRYQNEFFSEANTSETRYRREVFNKKIDYALKEKIIEIESDSYYGDSYRYYLNRIPGSWKNLDVSLYFKRRHGRYQKGRMLFEFLHEQNPESTECFRLAISLRGSHFFDRDGFYFKEIIEKEHWTQEQVDRTCDAYMRRIMRKNTWLYQQLQETLYRYYPIQKALKEQ